MSNNIINTGKRQQSKRTKDAISMNRPSVCLGYVRDNADPQKMGRLSVWIPEFGPDLADTYITVSYASPFAGTTDISDTKVDDKTEQGTQTSYGFWAVPPHRNCMVLVAFVNGDMARGYWFGCVLPQNMNHMVPALASNLSHDQQMNEDFAPWGPPVAEYNKKDTEVDPNSPKRAPSSALAEGLKTQGLNKDMERGITNSSARRESPSKTQGWSTPGGNQFVMEDGDEQQYIRIRTKSGTQLLVSETSGYIYMITKGGKSWMEISDGAIDLFSEAAVTIRTQDDLNLIADKDLNLDAMGDLNIRAGGNVRSYSGGNTDFAAAGALRTQAAGKASHSAGGDLAIGAGGALGMTAGGNLVAESGGANIRNGGTILDNSGGGGAVSPDEAEFKDPIELNGRSTIGSAVPTHEPYDHPINGTQGGASNGSESPNGGASVQSQRGDGTPVTASVLEDNSPVKKIGGYKVSDKVNGCIQLAAQRTGVPYATMMAVCAKESSFNPNAGATTSSAKGLFQFINSTWQVMYKKYGPNGTKVKNPSVKNNPMDPCSNALLGGYYLKENQTALAAAGLSTGATELYLCHFLGTGGGRSFLRQMKSNPNGSAASAFPSPARANKNIFYAKNGGARSFQAMYNFLHSSTGATVPQWQAYAQSKK